MDSSTHRTFKLRPSVICRCHGIVKALIQCGGKVHYCDTSRRKSAISEGTTRSFTTSNPHSTGPTPLIIVVTTAVVAGLSLNLISSGEAGKPSHNWPSSHLRSNPLATSSPAQWPVGHPHPWHWLPLFVSACHPFLSIVLRPCSSCFLSVWYSVRREGLDARARC